MGKKALEAAPLTYDNKVLDPTLASLFASSAGPVVVPERKTVTVLSRNNHVDKIIAKANNDDIAARASLSSTSDDEIETLATPPRKRRRVNEGDDIEMKYLDKLVREEEQELQAKQDAHLSATGNSTHHSHHTMLGNNEADDSISDTSASNDLLDLSDDDAAISASAYPQHETLSKDDLASTQTKRTVFLSNVCTSAIRSKAARKRLIAYLKSALTMDAKEKIESIRFRSTAFDVSAGPKKAAFAKKELMDQTSRNTNAYVVFSSEAAARRTAMKLNGTVILDRHIHVDSLANPMRTDNKRCVFVGNLPFVDEETTGQDSSDNDNEADSHTAVPKRKRQKAKLPADAEEGLWQTFSRCGKVESVRVVRDRATRVGKGFAYVQFEDGNGVEKALLLDGKKFPPLLPRLLRVSRAKAIKKRDVKARDSLRGRDAVRGRQKQHGKGPRSRTDQTHKTNGGGVVFEGYRASSDNKMKFKVKDKSRGKKVATKPASRSSRRGAAFRASGGKKNRDA